MAPPLIMQTLSELDLTSREVLRCEPFTSGLDSDDAVILYDLTLHFTEAVAGRGGLLDLPGRGQVRQCAGAAVRLPPGTCMPAASPGGSYSRQALGARSPSFNLDIASQRLLPRNWSCLLLMVRLGMAIARQSSSNCRRNVFRSP